MKKLIITAVAAMMAVFANAAAVDWNSGLVNNPNSLPTEVKIGKQTGDWIMTIAFYTDAAGKTAVTGLTGDFSDNSTLATSKFSGTVSGFSNNTTYYTQAIITDKDGNWSITSAISAFTVPETADASINIGDGTGLAGSVAGWNTSAIGKEGDLGKWVAAPEPTSGLLLLIGMAGLALKRKRA